LNVRLALVGFQKEVSSNNHFTMSTIGAKYSPPMLKKPTEEVVNAMTTQVVAKSNKYVLPSMREKGGGELFPELIGFAPGRVKSGGFSYSTLLKAKTEEPTLSAEEAAAEINVINDTICQSCHTNHGICVVDISSGDTYVPDPYYNGRIRWTKRPPTAMKKRTLFDEDLYYGPDDDSTREDVSKQSVIEDSDSVDTGSEAYEYEED
jgi:hypothetical protein